MYNKLFTKILDSSIWLEATPTRIVWLTFIAVMDELGFVQFAAVGNVASRARVTLEEAHAAIAVLEAPDAESGDPDHEGRRIERVPGGWLVLNAEKHRKLVTRAVIQDQTRERVRRHRERTRGKKQKRIRNARVTPSEARSEARSEKKQPLVVEPAKKPPDPRVREFLTWFQSEYKTRRHGADYLVKWDRDGALVKQMLGASSLDRLKLLAQVMLADKCADEFIIDSGRDITILNAKFNWLSDRLAEWETKRTAANES